MRSALLLPALFAVPAVLGAQTRPHLSVFTSTGADVRQAQVGAQLGFETGALGARLGIGTDAAAPPGEPVRLAADADATVRLGALGPALADARFFAGLGLRELDAGRVSASSSLGAGYTYRLLGPVGVEGELRYRVPFSQADPAGVEVRVGLSVGLARSAPRAAALVRVVEPVAVRAPRAPAAAVAARAISRGENFLGVPYRWGGNTPQEGFDCSGFLVYLFREQGIELPRVSRDQARAGEPLPLSVDALRPGDLMFFARDGKTIDHVAMYVGDRRILHSSSSGRGVRYDDLDTRRGQYYLNHFVAARRVVPDGALPRLDGLRAR